MHMEDEYYEENRFVKWYEFLLVGIGILGFAAMMWLFPFEPFIGLASAREMLVVFTTIGLLITFLGVYCYKDSINEKKDNVIPLKPRLIRVKDICEGRIRSDDGKWLKVSRDIEFKNNARYKVMLKTYPHLHMEERIVRAEEI
jgi:hypothetical protein